MEAKRLAERIRAGIRRDMRGNLEYRGDVGGPGGVIFELRIGRVSRPGIVWAIATEWKPDRNGMRSRSCYGWSSTGVAYPCKRLTTRALAEIAAKALPELDASVAHRSAVLRFGATVAEAAGRA